MTAMFRPVKRPFPYPPVHEFLDGMPIYSLRVHVDFNANSIDGSLESHEAVRKLEQWRFHDP